MGTTKQKIQAIRILMGHKTKQKRQTIIVILIIIQQLKMTKAQITTPRNQNLKHILRYSLKMSDFMVGKKMGKGQFG